MKIVQSLNDLIRITPDIQSIYILDKEGVPIVSAGDEIRNRNQFSGSYNASMEQVKKLGLGEHKYWVFLYEVNQLVLLNLEKFAVFIIANKNANTGVLCSLAPQLNTILKDCADLIDQIKSSESI